MQMITTMTQKGQITIPKLLRDQLAIKSYSKVFIKAERDHLKVYPVIDILDLAGSYQAPKLKRVLTAREKLEKKYKRF